MRTKTRQLLETRKAQDHHHSLGRILHGGEPRPQNIIPDIKARVKKRPRGEPRSNRSIVEVRVTVETR